MSDAAREHPEDTGETSPDPGSARSADADLSRLRAQLRRARALGGSGEPVEVDLLGAECRMGPERRQDHPEVIRPYDGRWFQVPACAACVPVMFGLPDGRSYYGRVVADASGPRFQTFGSAVGPVTLVEMDFQDRTFRCISDNIPRPPAPASGIVGRRPEEKPAAAGGSARPEDASKPPDAAPSETKPPTPDPLREATPTGAVTGPSEGEPAATPEREEEAPVSLDPPHRGNEQGAGASSELPELVTLDQAAALVNRTANGLRHYRRQGMPEPFVRGTKGKPNEYLWSEMRRWLEDTFDRKVPEVAILKFRSSDR
jgi:hypothetical protein